ncbi:MAG: 2-amino-4-hydroxy-6-hydroxymethyldihydropteridine diphosphokinase [Chitinophagales bacterium]
MHKVYLLTGSNEGNRQGNLARAMELIAQQCGAITAQSAIYETEAWGMKEQAGFLNQALCLHTQLAPVELLKQLKSIEKQVGRVETVKWGPRVIDIDILLFDNEVVNLPELIIPHPYMQERRFTLTPLADIAAYALHPVFNKSIAQLLSDCTDKSEVKNFTA